MIGDACRVSDMTQRRGVRPTACRVVRQRMTRLGGDDEQARYPRRYPLEWDNQPSLIVSYFLAFFLFWAPLCLVVGAKKYFFGALYKNSNAAASVRKNEPG